MYDATKKNNKMTSSPKSIFGFKCLWLKDLGKVYAYMGAKIKESPLFRSQHLLKLYL